MIPREPRPTRYRCDGCGTGRLLWERRSGALPGRFLATCTNPGCGHIETRLADGVPAEDGLRDFLLGDQPLQPYVPAWVRFFLRSSNAGAEWSGAGRQCSDCNGRLVMKLGIPWVADRPADPTAAVLCLECGALECTVCLPGEATELQMDGDAWAGLPIQLQVLKRAVFDRCSNDAGDEDEQRWHFG